MRHPGIEPGASRWQRDILPLNQWRSICTLQIDTSHTAATLLDTSHTAAILLNDPYPGQSESIAPFFSPPQTRHAYTTFRLRVKSSIAPKTGPLTNRTYHTGHCPKYEDYIGPASTLHLGMP